MPRSAREHELLWNGRLDFITAAALTVAAAAMFVLVGIPATRSSIQRIDDAFLRFVVAHRSGVLTAIAKVFNVLGGIQVTLPVRIAVAGYLALKRRWWHVAAFVMAVAVSEVSISTLKVAYGRTRPPGSLVATSGGSFPSGHAVATSVTVVAIVIALVPRGPHRWMWGTVAGVFSFVMAVSRAYLAAHWLSDAVAGTLLGITEALLSALLIQWLRHRHGRRAVERAEVPFSPPS
jgi:undecaprenyl-diphosphatase